MENKQFRKEDFIYIRISNDFEVGDRWSIPTKYKKGEILRFKKEWLIKKIVSRQFNNVFNQYRFDVLNYVENPNRDENDILYDKIYNSITISKNNSYEMCLWPSDLLYINDWLKSHVDSRDFRKILSSSEKIITDGKKNNNIIEISDENVKVTINFKEGEAIDFTDPAVKMLFYDKEWIKILMNSELVIGDEKDQLFNEDFSNAILAKDGKDIIFNVDSAHSLVEFHYFILNDEININNIHELINQKRGVLSLSCLHFLHEGATDKNGYIRVVYIISGSGANSDRNEEQEILNVARRATKEEVIYYHNKRIEEYKKHYYEHQEELERQCVENAKLLKEAYEKNKNSSSFFPGVNGEFVHVLDEKVQTIEQEKYSLQQIKEFFQNLKYIDSEILKEMCFYGGTIPYILTNAEESREFGDIDIFVPVPLMERLREELARQESFKMLYDSKPLAASCKLTSRIQLEKKALKTKEDKIKDTFEFIGLLSTIMQSNSNTVYIDENGASTDPLESYLSSRRDYYNKTQDFGFKANLFGINISVFPLYQYGNDIMAKSFNVNELYKFLLGVRVLNNSQISDFVKNIQIYDSTIKILPIEYTLVSKKSAIEANFENRLSKDTLDIEYIMNHKEELGISDELIEQIKANYPNYSVSIAYKINPSGKTTTMRGESYKKYVLINKGTLS